MTMDCLRASRLSRLTCRNQPAPGAGAGLDAAWQPQAEATGVWHAGADPIRRFGAIQDSISRSADLL